MSRGVVTFLLILFVIVMTCLYVKYPVVPLFPAQAAQSVAGQGEPPVAQFKPVNPIVDFFLRALAFVMCVAAVVLVVISFMALFGIR